MCTYAINQFLSKSQTNSIWERRFFKGNGAGTARLPYEKMNFDPFLIYKNSRWCHLIDLNVKVKFTYSEENIFTKLG